MAFSPETFFSKVQMAYKVGIVGNFTLCVYTLS